MFCTSACVAPQAVEEVDVVNDKVFRQMDEMRKALEDVKSQLAEERKQRKEMQLVQSNILRADTSSLLRADTQALRMDNTGVTSTSKSNESVLDTTSSTLTAEDRRLAAKYKDRMIDGVVVTYLKERTEKRMTAVCCLDVDCNYMVLLSGKVEFSTREILCQTAKIMGAFTLTPQDKDIFPPAVVAMLRNDDEVDRTLMITYTDSNDKKIRFCMVMESAEARNSFKTTLDVIVESKKFGGVDDEDDKAGSEAGSEGIF